jgi:D-amino-acid dehydrogenase
MRVLILGAGVIGVSTAYYLARSGHEVTVLDRQAAPGQETSYANAGEISPGYAAPWSGPGVPLKALKWLLMRHPPMVIKPSLDPALWRWLAAFLGNCQVDRYRVNKSRMLRLAQYSRDRLRDLRASTGIHYDERSLGTLQLFRTQKQLDACAGDAALLREHGIPHSVLDREQITRYEPALAAVPEKFVGGLHLPGDETGDCHKFTRQLADLAVGLGVRFVYNSTAFQLAQYGQLISSVRASTGLYQADAYLVALGSHAPRLLAPLGIKLPVYPVKGYSITVPIVDEEGAPRSTVMDETHKVAITRLGDRIRVGGTAELAGFNLDRTPARIATLEHVLGDLFPRGGDPDRVTGWAGLRPMTPDGTPVLGPTPYANLYLGTGHGTLGWTMAAGTGKLLADLLSRRQPEIDLAGLTLARYGSNADMSHPPLALTA